MLRIFRSWTLQRYVLGEFAISFVLAVTACTLLMLLGVFFMKAADYEEFGVTTGQVAMLFPYLLPRALSWAIPPAAMIAVTTVFGRLSAENEIIAAQAGGAPLRVLAFPILIAGLLLSGFCLWCNQGLLSWGNSTIRNEIFKLDKPEFFTNLERPGNSVPLKPEGGGVVHINWLPHEKDEKTGQIRRPIHIAYFQNQDVGQTVLARDYTADPSQVDQFGSRILVLTLKDAQVFGERQPQSGAGGTNRPNLSDMQSFCKEFTLQITLPRPSKLLDLGKTRGEVGWWDNYEQAELIKNSRHARHHFMLQRAAEFGAHAVAGSPADAAAPLLAAQSWNEARIASEAAYGTGGARDRANAEEAECYRKLGLSFLPLSTVILGIGLGLLVRKSARLIGFMLGLLVYALLYYPMMIVSKEMVRGGLLPLWALFIPNAVLLLMGYVLWRAYERGWLENISSWLSSVIQSVVDWREAFSKPLESLSGVVRRFGFALFRGKTDGYITGSFVAPLFVVLLSVSAIRVTLDLFQHGEEVIDGIQRAAEPLDGIKRTQAQAVVDVFSYYGIRALEMICDILPLLILLAGVLCVTAIVRNNEHLIFKSSGIRLQRAFRPIIATTLMLSLAVTAMRETCMPALIMTRDYLKPLVYHRNPAPTALAIHTVDSENRPVLFQMSQYSSTKREGTALRIYHLGRDERTPVITADKAYWDGTAWKLRTDTHKLVAFNSRQPQLPKDPASRFAPHGYLISYSSEGHAGAAPQPDGEIRQVRTQKKPIAEWRGAVTPAFLESERLGSGVMGLTELQAASRVKPELNVEWWRRISEWTLAVFLLWLTIPLLVSEVRGPFMGVALSILLGGMSWALTVACTEAGRTGAWPSFAPLFPPILFLVLGSITYYRKMPT
ncbi:MAG TPA: LptF/LptG family permease [Planctomycetota bacterium]|nr:LptF/LptG family permease [Planctomycetota bacterium]